MNSPDVHRLCSCFAELASGRTEGKTRKAFIFSLKNSEALPPFKCLATYERKAIYKNLNYGPSFGRGPYFTIYGTSAQDSMASIQYPYSVPREFQVNSKECVLAGTKETFSPDNYEVFYLA